MSKAASILDKIRGSMIGAVIGDCLGSPVECQYWDGIPLIPKCVKHFQKYQDSDPNHTKFEYTDDTAMARQVADSIITMKNVDSKDMAQRFVKEYFKEPGRGYGASVADVFKKLRKTECSDPFGPASEQFNGSGSYGNGAAMRVHPVGLFCYEKSNESLIENVKKSAKVTHYHPDAVNGAIIQAAAVKYALEGSYENMGKKLIDLSKTFDKPSDAVDLSYTEKLELIDKCVSKPYAPEVLITKLGNDVSALNSVPASIYSFMAVTQPGVFSGYDESFSENPFERSLMLAMSFGGDTDTIMSMTAAIAGAYYGESAIPEYMKHICEGVENARKQADQLHKIMTQ